MSTPWLKWYPSDWRSDARLKLCSLAARGLWIELIGYMHEAEPYGHLLINSANPTAADIAKLTGSRRDTIAKLIEELEKNGVFSTTNEGVIYSRKMVRDCEKANKDRENGRKGGLRSASQGVDPPVGAQILEARSQIPESRKKVEERASAPRAKSKPIVQIPDDFILTADRAKVAIDLGLDAAETFRKYRQWAVTSGRKLADWDTRWAMWCEDQIKFSGPVLGDDGLPRFSDRAAQAAARDPYGD